MFHDFGQQLRIFYFIFLFSLLLHLVGAFVFLSECVNVFSPVQLDLGTIEYSMKLEIQGASRPSF